MEDLALPTERRFPFSFSFFLVNMLYSVIFIQSPASLHSMLSAPRWYLGTHSHFVAPNLLHNYWSWSLFSPICLPLVSSANSHKPHLAPPTHTHTDKHTPLTHTHIHPKCSLVTNECWPGIYFLLPHLLSVSLCPPPLYLHPDLPIYLSPATIPKQMATLSLRQKQWLWTTALRGALFTLTLDLISWYPARNVICQWQKCINHIAQCRYSHLRLSSWLHA